MLEVATRWQILTPDGVYLCEELVNTTHRQTFSETPANIIRIHSSIVHSSTPGTRYSKTKADADGSQLETFKLFQCDLQGRSFIVLLVQLQLKTHRSSPGLFSSLPDEMRRYGALIDPQNYSIQPGNLLLWLSKQSAIFVLNNFDYIGWD